MISASKRLFFTPFTLTRSWAAAFLNKAETDNRAASLSTIAINMWKEALLNKNLSDENKTSEEITAAAKEFRELFLNNTFQSSEVVQEIKIVDSTNAHIPLEKQIAMFPEAGRFSGRFRFSF